MQPTWINILRDTFIFRLCAVNGIHLKWVNFEGESQG
jgi:hypothetical protein